MKKAMIVGFLTLIITACTHHGARMPQAWVDEQLDKEANAVDHQFRANEKLNKKEQKKQGQ